MEGKYLKAQSMVGSLYSLFWIRWCLSLVWLYCGGDKCFLPQPQYVSVSEQNMTSVLREVHRLLLLKSLWWLKLSPAAGDGSRLQFEEEDSIVSHSMLPPDLFSNTCLSQACDGGRFLVQWVVWVHVDHMHPVVGLCWSWELSRWVLVAKEL